MVSNAIRKEKIAFYVLLSKRLIVKQKEALMRIEERKWLTIT